MVFADRYSTYCLQQCTRTCTPTCMCAYTCVCLLFICCAIDRFFSHHVIIPSSSSSCDADILAWCDDVPTTTTTTTTYVDSNLPTSDSALTHPHTQQCLRLEANDRPTCSQILRHDFFLVDDFNQRFPQELRAKISKESDNNPLLLKIRSTASKDDDNKDTKDRENNSKKKRKDYKDKYASDKADKYDKLHAKVSHCLVFSCSGFVILLHTIF